MKKVCPECGHVNPYDIKVCEKCGYDLETQIRYKVCPNCGKEFSLKAELCDVCKDELVVRGKRVAQIFDEQQKEEVPVWIRVFAAFVPIIGYIIAVAYCIIAVEDKKMDRETSKHLLLTSAGIQALVLIILGFIIGICMGSGWALMRQVNG